MQVKNILFISCILLCTFSVSAMAQFANNQIKLSKQDSIEYVDDILMHIFTVDLKEAIPAAEKLYILADKYKSKVEMFQASAVLTSHYSLLGNEAKYSYWKNRAKSLYNGMDDNNKAQNQALYEQIASASELELDNTNDLYSSRAQRDMLRSQERTQEALAVARQIVEKSRTQGINDKDTYISDLISLGALYGTLHNDSAEIVMNEALSMSIQNRYIHLQQILDTFILVCIDLDDTSNGLLICNKYIELLNKTYDTPKLELYQAYKYKALLLFNEQKYKEALVPYFLAFDIQKALVQNVFPFLTEDDRYYYWQSNFENNVNFTEYSFKKDVLLNEDLIEKAYDQQLLEKGVLLNTTDALRREFEKNYSLQEKWTTLCSLRNKLLDNQNNTQLEVRANRLERELSEAVDLSSFRKEFEISSRDVYNALGKNDLAVEFVEITLSGNRPFFAFLTIDKKNPKPQLKTFFAVKWFKEKLADDFTKTCDVYETLWKRLLEKKDGIKNIYFAPTDIFNTLPIEYCMTDNGQLMSERFNMYRVLSTRELVTGKKNIRNKRACVYGGIDYESPVSELRADARKYPKPKLTKDVVKRGSDVLRNWKDGIDPLPQTKSEAISICNTLEHFGYKPKPYLEKDATEASFKSLSGQSPAILHIGTHGFFWNKEDISKYSDLNFMARLNNSSQHEDLALSHSGILFAGAYNVMRNVQVPEGVDDGVCTSAEISRLDLSNTDLVVLSACDTGLGEMESDGVFGLQRGFKKAGVNSILMSLWKVNDKATMLLMTEFYKQLASGKSKTASLREAQKYVRSYNNGYYKDKENWAGFILVDGIK